VVLPPFTIPLLQQQPTLVLSPLLYPTSPALLQVLFDAHLGSLKAVVERSLFVNEPGVHTLTKRYAALSASLLQLMANQELDDGARGLGGGRGQAGVRRAA
jgi:hypothetical protein